MDESVSALARPVSVFAAALGVAGVSFGASSAHRLAGFTPFFHDVSYLILGIAGALRPKVQQQNVQAPRAHHPGPSPSAVGWQEIVEESTILLR